MSITQAKTEYVFQAAAADATSSTFDAVGYSDWVLMEVVETAGGTVTLQVNGSIDGTNWYVVGHNVLGNTASPARSVTAISVTADLKQTYQILDYYPKYQAVLTSSSSESVSVRFYAVA